MRNIGSNVKRAPNQEPIAVASAKNHACRENCGIPVKRRPGYTPSPDARRSQRSCLRPPPVRYGFGCAAYAILRCWPTAPRRNSRRTCRGSSFRRYASAAYLPDESACSSPTVRHERQKLQNLPAPAGKFARHGPKRAGDAKIVGRENTGCDHRRAGAQNLINQVCLKCCHDMCLASELRRCETRSAHTTPITEFAYT